MNWEAIGKIIGDVITTIPAIEIEVTDVKSSIPVVEKIAAALEAGTMPTLTPDEMSLFQSLAANTTKLVANTETLAADVKALGL
jgi:hypothetical protein